MSVPGHHLADLILIGDCAMVHPSKTGGIAGVLLLGQVDNEPLHIGVIADPGLWPAGGLSRGDRVWIRGRLRIDTLWHRKATHFVQATHPVELIKRGQRAS